MLMAPADATPSPVSTGGARHTVASAPRWTSATCRVLATPVALMPRRALTTCCTDATIVWCQCVGCLTGAPLSVRQGSLDALPVRQRTASLIYPSSDDKPSPCPLTSSVTSTGVDPVSTHLERSDVREGGLVRPPSALSQRRSNVPRSTLAGRRPLPLLTPGSPRCRRSQ